MKKWKKSLTAHMVVRNEEKWIWYSIMAIVRHVDQIIIFDTGSTDKTVEIIKLIIDKQENKQQIIFERKGSVDRHEFVKLRDEQVKRTNTDYFIVIDGDEVYYDEQFIELREALDSEDSYQCGVMNFRCCAGDVFHYRDPQKEHYGLGERKGAITLRVFSKHISDIHCGDLEGKWDGYYDINNNYVIPDNGFKTFWGTGFYLHMSYMQRSSSLNKDAQIKWPGNRLLKLKNSCTWDYAFEKDFKFPEVFYKERPLIVKSPWAKQKNIIRIIMQFLKNIQLKIKKIQ